MINSNRGADLSRLWSRGAGRALRPQDPEASRDARADRKFGRGKQSARPEHTTTLREESGFVGDVDCDVLTPDNVEDLVGIWKIECIADLQNDTAGKAAALGQDLSRSQSASASGRCRPLRSDICWRGSAPVYPGLSRYRGPLSCVSVTRSAWSPVVTNPPVWRCSTVARISEVRFSGSCPNSVRTASIRTSTPRRVQ